MSVSSLYELLPIHFLSFETSIHPDRITPHFLLAWLLPREGISEQGELVLIPPGIRATLLLPVSFYRIASFYSSMLNNHAIIESLDEPLCIPTSPYMEQLINNIQIVDNNSSFHRRQIELSNTLFSLIAEMIHLFSSSRETAIPSLRQPIIPSQPISSDGKSIIRATRFIRMNMADPDLSLQQIASAIGYNPNYFCYKFSCILNVSPIRFLKMIRLERALQLLKNTDFSIQAICPMVGIRNPSSLASLVKGYSGLTPMEFRMKNKQQIYS